MPHFSLPILRRRRRHDGFTLVELVIVMAITSLLATIAFIGQHQLQQRFRFDSAVNQTIQNLAFARNFASSNVNAEGAGNNTGALLIGVGLEFDKNHPSNRPLTEIEPVYASPDSENNPIPSTFTQCPAGHLVGGNCNACPAAEHPIDPDECFEQFLALSDDLTLAAPGINEAVIYFLNTSQGLEVCHDIGAAYSSIATACTFTRGMPVNIDVVDGSGLKSTIQVDPTSGYAKRLN